jgi:hypothetical protein
VLCGVAPRERFADVSRVLKESLHASPYMERYVLEALLVMGEPEAARARLKKRYGKLALSPVSTLPERWNPQRTDSTYDHGYNAGLVTLLSGRVAGIAPLEPGYKRYAIRPRMGDLARVRCSVQAPSGGIDLALENGKRSFRMSLSSPEGTEAVVTLPVPVDAVIRCTCNGIPRAQMAAFTAGPGAWELQAEW